MGKTKTAEQDHARLLYLNESLTAKEIAERVGVTEKTIGKWIAEGNWETLKVSLMTTKDTQLAKLYGQLAALQHHIATRPVVRDIPSFLLKPVKLKNAAGDEYLDFPKINEEDYPIKIGNVATAADADIISKITTSIKRLETETSIGEIISVAKQVIEFVRLVDVDFAKRMASYFDAFIDSKMQ